ncbi:uncharacterized protein F5Z01DRAFT_662024 [Emericellopsis atlantica]|uniref:RAD52 homolog n=1 Tax=Emericellopsis atlantica TaxID=2614577 RepID=A0A9P7ZI55_9HYPO|nr:uncharacterized protein F5Z01DRAFT_662024 [Emericellopsis atlantica]KAG9252122.1 hypothetical protein F5Z01DRAFT_662024 [Emericellopsis atlantica]
MPAPGQQHQSWQNPYDEPKPRMSLWTAQEIATIASKLDKQLGPEYISARAGPGGQRVHYLTAEKCITLANEVFGFNGWSSSIQNIQVDFADENPQTSRVSIGLSVIVRITLRDGTYHEDIGYGSIENAKGKAMAFEKAKKEGTTDGLKRALRSFGNVLGNCIYDQDYVKQVVKHKAQPVKKFDPNNLHRHSDFKEDVKVDEPAKAPAAPAAAMPAPQIPPPQARPKMEASESFEDFLGELDEADFCVPEDGHPDEIVLPGPPEPAPRPMQPNTSNRQPQTPNQPAPARPQQQAQPQQNRPVPPAPPHQQPRQGAPTAAPAAVPETVGFFSAKAVSQLPEASIQGEGESLLAPRGQQAFNPKLESPSIRKTPGIDHSASKPLSRSGQHVPPSSSQAQTSNAGSFTPVRPGQPRTANAVNPGLDHARRIGAPGGPGSPLGNRGSFRQPTMMKRPQPEGGRPALADLPANANGNPQNGIDDMDAKRQKTA